MFEATAGPANGIGLRQFRRVRRFKKNIPMEKGIFSIKDRR
jgi:hypothetical protein